MPGAVKIEFAPLSIPAKGVLILFCDEGMKFGSVARRVLEPTGELIARAASAERFKGKNGSALDIVAPPGLDATRLIKAEHPHAIVIGLSVMDMPLIRDACLRAGAEAYITKDRAAEDLYPLINRQVRMSQSASASQSSH